MPRSPRRSPDQIADPIAFRAAAVARLERGVGVYALCDLDSVPIYVGQLVDGIQSRVRRHLTFQRLTRYHHRFLEQVGLPPIGSQDDQNP